MNLLKLTEPNGKPVYLNPEHVVAVRYVEDYERTDKMRADTVRVEMVERSFNVREPLLEVIAALEAMV